MTLTSTLRFVARPGPMGTRPRTGGSFVYPLGTYLGMFECDLVLRRFVDWNERRIIARVSFVVSHNSLVTGEVKRFL